MQQAPAAAAAVAGVSGGEQREEEAPEYPPPPAYYRLFAPPVPNATAGMDEEGDGDGEEQGQTSELVGSGGGSGRRRRRTRPGQAAAEEEEEEEEEEDDSFPLPPPALPRRGQRVEVFGFPLAFLDEERYDPIVPPEARLYPFAEAHTRDANAHDDGNGGGNDDDGGVGVVATGQGGGEDGGGPGVAVVELDFRGELKRLQALLVARIPALLFALRTDALAATSQTSPSPSPPQPAATAGAAGPGPGGHGHAALLGEVVQAVDNMHDVLSAYRQHQALVQMVERMEAQCREKRAAISRLKSCIAESQAAAAGASAGLVAALTRLVQEQAQE